MSRRRKVALVVIALLLAGVVAVVVGSANAAAARARQRAEAAEIRAAHIEGLLVAETVARADLLLDIADGLRARIDAVSAVSPEVRVVERADWRTGAVAIPCENPLPPPAALSTPVPSGDPTPDPPPPQGGPPEPPSIALYVVGREARLLTRAGNWLAVGEVDLIREDDDVVLATLPWEADASRLLRAREEPRAAAGGRWLVGLGLGLVDGELGLGGVVAGPGWEPRLWGRSLGRWRPWAAGAVAGVDLYVPAQERAVRRSQACLAGGVGLEW